MKVYLDGDWVYPLRVTNMTQGKALTVHKVLCYRNDPNFGYSVKRDAASVNIIMAVPRKDPLTSEQTYILDEDRAYMYCTLRAVFETSVVKEWATHLEKSHP